MTRLPKVEGDKKPKAKSRLMRSASSPYSGIRFRFAPRYADGPTARCMTHMFAMRCEAHGIEHRATLINHPWCERPG